MSCNIVSIPTGMATRLRILREARYLTQSDLAVHAGLSSRTVYELESGRRDRVQAKTLMLLAEALEISYEELIRGDATSLAIPSDNVQVALVSAGFPRPATLAVSLIAFAAIVYLAVVVANNSGNSDLKWGIENGALVVRSTATGEARWRRHFENGIRMCDLSPWSEGVLLVALKRQSVEGGRLLALDLDSGHTLWEAEPNLATMAEAFGTEAVYSGGFHCWEFYPVDLNGDGDREVLVYFKHSKWYPAALCVFDKDGHRTSQYANKGLLYDVVVLDLDNDGKDEILAAGTNNAREYQGGTIILLDDKHRNGVAIDPITSPTYGLPDSSLVRVVFPQFPQDMMDALGTIRLTASQITVFRDSIDDIRISVNVGRKSEYFLIVEMDSRLRPLKVSIGDAFRYVIQSSWPDTLVVKGPTDPDWRAEWLTHHLRLEAGVMVESSQAK